MIEVLLVSISAFLLLFLFPQDKKLVGLRIAFFLVTALSAFRYNYGTDHINYASIYDNIVSVDYNLDTILSGSVYKDPLWAVFCYFFSCFGCYGFFVFVAAISVFHSYLIYRLIYEYVDSEDWHFAFFIFMFNPFFYMLSLSMLRQILAMSFCLLAFLIYKPKFILLSILLLLLAYFTHSSAFVMLGVLPILLYGFNKTKIISLFLLLVFLFLFIFREELALIISPFLTIEDFDLFYEKYADRGSVRSFGVVFLLNTIPFIICIKDLYRESILQERTKHVVVLSCIGTLFIPLSALVQMISRMSLYFSIFSIAAIPIVYREQQKTVRIMVVSCYILSELVQYYLLYLGPNASLRYDVYQTIFEVL